MSTMEILGCVVLIEFALFMWWFSAPKPSLRVKSRKINRRDRREQRR